MREIVLKHIHQRFASLLELIESFDPSSLTTHLNVPKNKSVGEHMWCIIGARESYTRALQHGAWDGFSCSLNSTDDHHAIILALNASAVAFDTTINALTWDSAREGLLVQLLEHETMHEGQLIRHIYALEHPVPSSIKWS